MGDFKTRATGIIRSQLNSSQKQKRGFELQVWSTEQERELWARSLRGKWHCIWAIVRCIRASEKWVTWQRRSGIYRWLCRGIMRPENQQCIRFLSHTKQSRLGPQHFRGWRRWIFTSSVVQQISLFLCLFLKTLFMYNNAVYILNNPLMELFNVVLNRRIKNWISDYTNPTSRTRKKFKSPFFVHRSKWQMDRVTICD